MGSSYVSNFLSCSWQILQGTYLIFFFSGLWNLKFRKAAAWPYSSVLQSSRSFVWECKMWCILFLSDSNLLYFGFNICYTLIPLTESSFISHFVVEVDNWKNESSKICVVYMYYIAFYMSDDHKSIIAILLTMTVWNKNWKLL